MSFYGAVFRLLGWLIALGLITGEYTYYANGTSDGWMVAAGWGILVWWAVVTWPYIAAIFGWAAETVAEPSRAATRAAAAEAMTATGAIQCPTCHVRGSAEPVVRMARQAFALRGHHEGRPIVRCLHCDAGFSLSVGMNRPMLIAADRWTAMDALWRSQFPEIATNEDMVLSQHRTLRNTDGVY
jgi:hypothetical protein